MCLVYWGSVPKGLRGGLVLGVNPEEEEEEERRRGFAMATKKTIKKKSSDNKTYASLHMEKIELVQLKPHPRNPRIHPMKDSPQWNALKKSLESDYFDPIVWNRTNGLLVSGHLRTKVLMDAGFTHADAVIVNYDEATHLARMIAANRLQGEDDAALMKDLFEELDTGAFDMELTGFSESELEDIMAPLNEEMEKGSSEVEFTEEIMETSQYIVLYFNNEIDWQTAFAQFGLETKKTPDSRQGYERRGIGRVINGVEVLKRMNLK